MRERERERERERNNGELCSDIEDRRGLNIPPSDRKERKSVPFLLS